MGLFKSITKTVKKVVTNPVGAFVLGGTAGLAALGAYKAVKAMSKRGVQHYGYPPMAHHCCQRYLRSPTAMCGRGGLTAFAGIAASARTHGELSILARAAATTPTWQHPIGRANMMQIIAANHARISFDQATCCYV